MPIVSSKSHSKALKAALLAMTSLSLGACAGIGEGTDFLTKAATPLAGDSTLSKEVAENQGPAAPGDLEKATEYWGKEFAQKPQSLEAALSYARNLKALGKKQQAVAVLQQASVYHGANKSLASEYGRLALELDQVTVAEQLLALADDPAAPDWRVISARGTAMAKQGKYQQAIPLYERAMTLAPDKPSIMNNLAMALTMNGEASRAEELLRKAKTAGNTNSKVDQNLALVLGLQGKYDEATKVASAQLTPDKAAANTALVRQMVKLEPKVMPQGVIAVPPPVQVAGSGPGAVAAAAAAATGLKPAVSDTSPSTAPGAWTTKVAAQTATPAAKKPAAAPKAPEQPAFAEPIRESVLRPSAE